MKENKKTKLSVFDFDGTLVDSGTPERFKPIYKSKTGKDWPHVGFWGRAESLDMNIFNIKSIPDVVTDYNVEKSNPNNIVVMLTGRLLKLQKEVKAILDANGLVFDEYHYNRGGATEIAKMKTMESLLDKYPTVTEIQIWEDRILHVPIFEEWGKKLCLSGRLKDFSITVVLSPNHTVK